MSQEPSLKDTVNGIIDEMAPPVIWVSEPGNPVFVAVNDDGLFINDATDVASAAAECRAMSDTQRSAIELVARHAFVAGRTLEYRVHLDTYEKVFETFVDHGGPVDISLLSFDADPDGVPTMIVFECVKCDEILPWSLAWDGWVPVVDEDDDEEQP